MLDRSLGNFVEADAKELSIVFLFRFALQLFSQMPRDGLTFSIRIRREEHLIDLRRLFLNVRQYLRFSLDRHILRREIVFQVNAKLTRRKILDMADRSHHGITTPKILADGSCFRWGL